MADIEALAAALLGARRSRVPIGLPAPPISDAGEAFAVQAAVARALGPAGAWKAGGRNEVAAYTAAPIAASLVRSAPCRWPASELRLIGIEAEVAFRIGRDLPAGSDEAAVRAAVTSVHAAIEVVDSRFDGWPVPDLLAQLADNQNNGGLVVEPTGRPWSGEVLDRLPVRITVDGRSVFDAEGLNAAGDPFGLVLRAAEHAGRHDGGLRAGAFVTTGSLNGILFVEPGAAVVATVGNLGEVAVAFPT